MLSGGAPATTEEEGGGAPPGGEWGAPATLRGEGHHGTSQYSHSCTRDQGPAHHLGVGGEAPDGAPGVGVPALVVAADRREGVQVGPQGGPSLITYHYTWHWNAFKMNNK